MLLNFGLQVYLGWEVSFCFVFSPSLTAAPPRVVVLWLSSCASWSPVGTSHDIFRVLVLQ